MDPANLCRTRYRELVGTAETIVSMNREVQQVEFNLTDVGRRCNPKLVERKQSHLNQIKEDAPRGTLPVITVLLVFADNVGKRELGAQLSLLHRCTASISGILRRRGSPLLVAKLLVVCRLLHNTLSKDETAPPFLESLRNQLASLRQTLLKRTDRRLASANSSTDDIIEALSAYCLATSSSSDDVIHRFHQLRLESIGNYLKHQSGEDVLKALTLYIRTLQSSKTILSRRLSDTLAKLKTRPLLSDPEILGLDALGIDVLGRWVAPDISNFTPWIKLSELNKQDSEKITKQWSKQAFETFAKGCQQSLTDWTDVSELLSLRKSALDTWLESWSSTPAHSSLAVLEGIRTVFNGQLTRVLADEAKKLESFGQHTSSVISGWDDMEHANAQSLWDQGLISMDYSNGAADFKQTVVDRLLGRNEDVSTVLKDYESWLASINRSRELVDEMRRASWVDILDEDEGIDVTATLNEDDPRLLSDALQQAVKEAFNNLQSSFSNTFSSVDSDSQKAAFVLRLIRQVRREIPTAYISSEFAFSSDIVPKLQEILTTEVAAHAGSLDLNTDPTKVPGRTLWEGEPELPVQPSPSTFRFLRSLMNTMDDCGSDLWDPSTVHVLKETLQKEVSTNISSALENVDSPVKEPDEAQADSAKEPASEEPPPETKQNLHDLKIQLFFDTVYLHNVLTSKSSESQLTGLSERIKGSLDSELQDHTSRMEKSAAEYWTRTKLLFGLLG